MKNMKKLIILLFGLQINILLANELNYPPILIEGFRVLKQQNLETPEFKDFAAEVLKQETDKLNDLWDHNRNEYCVYRKNLTKSDDPFFNAFYVDDMNCNDRDEEPFLLYDTIIKKAEDYIAAGMKDQYLQALYQGIKNKVDDIYQIDNPIFNYVMQTEGKKAFQAQNAGDKFDKFEMLYFIEFIARKQKWFDTGVNGSTLLHFAAQNNLKEVVQLLLDAGANKDIQDNDDRTPLHSASRNNSKEVIQLLLEAGADKD